MKKLTFDDFLAKAYHLYGDKYDYSNVKFVNTSTKVCVSCPEHGLFWITPSNFLNGHKCPACSGRERITTEIFIARSIKVQKVRYDYSKTEYLGLSKLVTIICPIHGEFQQKAAVHLKGSGCPKCFGTPKATAEDFIRKAKELYGDIYDYSKVVYNGNEEKVCIICHEHGEWWMSPNNHLRGHRCPGCYGTPKHTNEEFISMARRIHGDKYDYSKIEYNGNKKNVCIICPQHGEFWQTPNSHLNGGGCPTCSGTLRITLPIFIERCTQTHKGKYDYSLTNFEDLDEFVTIICPEHGAFEQRAKVHYRGYGCPICGGSKRLTNEEFIEKAQKVHKNKYDYSKVNYINTSTKVCIICPQHGEFWQTPNNHLFGAGCPTCPQSSLEGEVRQFLSKNNIIFEQEKTFDWLKYNKKMFLDFYLPEYKIAIECQGGQHFFPTDLFGGEDFFKLTLERDRIKKELCKKHGVNILYYSNAHIEYPYPVFESLRLLLKAIRQKGFAESYQITKQLELPLVFE